MTFLLFLLLKLLRLLTFDTGVRCVHQDHLYVILYHINQSSSLHDEVHLNLSFNNAINKNSFPQSDLHHIHIVFSILLYINFRTNYLTKIQPFSIGKFWKIIQSTICYVKINCLQKTKVLKSIFEVWLFKMVEG